MAALAPAYDVVVIGAGINGAAIARAAAHAGLSVGLLEQSDFAAGTTGASTRLIHGGLRYLEHAELGLVRESLRERAALLELAPHLVAPLRLYLPIYSSSRRGRWQIRAGMALYDWFSRDGALPRHRMLARADMLERIPGLAADGLVGGASYFDAQLEFPERLVVENVVAAAHRGAGVANHTRVERIEVRGGAVAGIEWRDGDGRSGRIAARFVVNAAGPWIDRVLARVDFESGRAPVSPQLVGGTKGSHLVVAALPGLPRAAIYAEAASDGRPFFIVPWNGMHLIGTTDVRYAGDPADAAIDDAELAYLAAETERLLPHAGSVAERVLYTQAGVRPLPYRPGAFEGAITRRHLVHRHAEARGLYSVVGGKLTTHRSLAADVVRRLLRDGAGSAEPRGAAKPLEDPLPGAADPAARDALLSELTARHGEHGARRLWRTYGLAARRISADAAARPELGAPVFPGAGLLRAELMHAIESEWAVTLVDILQRRTMVGLGPDFGLEAAGGAATALTELGVWDRQRAEAELEAYVDHASRSRVRPRSAGERAAASHP